jgi:alpha-tubulin suppressor-like RCC1 family protein
MALASNGSVYVWGQSDGPEFGNGRRSTTSMIIRCPVRVHLPAGVRIKQIALDYAGGLALSTTGQAYQWGELINMADLTTSVLATPTLVKAPAGVTFRWIKKSGSASFALGSDGRMYAWGQNWGGQLGIGGVDENYHALPSLMVTPPGVRFVRAAAGIASDPNGNVYTFGGNYWGQLGDGTRQPCPRAPCSPTYADAQRVVHLAGAHVFAVAGNDTLTDDYALATNGNVYAWGANSAGAVGNSRTAVVQALPARVSMPRGTRVTQLAADSGGGALALTSTGRIYGWGSNADGIVGGVYGVDRHGRVIHHSNPLLVG